MSSQQQVAVIGSGAAGLSAAWMLRASYRVTLIESDTRIGGHVSTVLAGSDPQTPVDTGFIVYNERNYPHLCGLFDTLGIETRASDMSFAASIDDGAVEYSGSDLNGLFAQRRNLFSPAHYRMLKDILRFNREAQGLLEQSDAPSLSLGQFLDQRGYSSEFVDRYLLPMAAAIWSCPAQTMREFPVLSLVRFFHNHGLIALRDRPRWRTVVGGSHTYAQRIIDALEQPPIVGNGAVRVQAHDNRPTVTLQDGTQHSFDHVILACHADQALALLDDPSPRHRDYLGRFHYQENRTLLHTDPALMPRSRRVWSSWNYLADGRQRQDSPRLSVTYWMNKLQGLPPERPYFVTLNPLQEPAEGHLLKTFTYHHPIFDEGAMAAQTELHQLQGEGHLWFCGSYFGYGFHEDALRSSVEVANALGVTAPWQAHAPKADAA